MTKVSMRVDYTLDGFSVEDQIRIAAESGADAVETGELKGYDCKKAAAAASRNGIRFVACGLYDMWNIRVGAPFAGIEDSMRRTVDCAGELGCKYIMSLTIDSEDRSAAGRERFVANILPVVDLCEKNGMVLVLESHSTKYVNPLIDMSGYFLDRSELAYTLLRSINSANAKLLFDFYHIQSMEGDIMMNLKQHIDQIAHFHIAGVPNRDEPMNGELHYQNLVRYVNSLGYDRHFGLEYFPTDKNDLETLAKAVAFIKNA